MQITPYSLEALRTRGDAPARPHGNCYWLVPGVLLAGEYPRTPEEASSRTKLRATLQAGVRHFVDLTEAHEGLLPYDGLLSEEAAARGLTVSHERHAIRDLEVPTDADALRVLLARLRAPREGATYVHCWGGIGRTGTVVGVWHVHRDHSPEAALERIAAARSGTIKAGRPSPENPVQIEAIRQAHARQRPADVRAGAYVGGHDRSLSSRSSQ